MVSLTRILLFSSLLLLICGPAHAAPADNPPSQIDVTVTHLAITILGLVVAARLAWQAFARDVTVAEFPTIPRYMTSRRQYLLGSAAFVLFSCGFCLALTQVYRDVIALLPPGEIPAGIGDAAQDRSAPYLAVVTAIGGVYLYLLTKEADWNVLLMMRDVIRLWISVPQLAKQIIAQIRFALRVPQEVVPQIVGSSPAVAEQDFHKDRATLDRVWAETCYMRWWLQQGNDAGNDATFFTEESFGFDKLTEDFEQASWSMRALKSGSAPVAQCADINKSLHCRFARLVACYLIYRNGSRPELCKEARAFGVNLSVAPVLENPVRYWIVYAVALIASVYVGVIFSAVLLDALDGKGIAFAQDPHRVLAWIMYSMCNFGFAIIIVLLLRLVAHSLGPVAGQSPMVTYCWTFLAAFVVGPFGLALAVHFFGETASRSVPFSQLYFGMLRWGLGPALISVYITYYLDRQTCPELPDIEASAATLGWRLVNCLWFAIVTVVLLLPAILTLSEPVGAIWDTGKLRFIATGTTFSVALGLALAAQFALLKQRQPVELMIGDPIV